MTTRITNAILADIGKIITARSSELGFRIFFTLHIGDLEDVLSYTIDMMSIERNFVTESFDKIEIKVNLPLGTMTHVIFPNRDILEATVTLDYGNFKGNEINTDLRPLTRRYKVILPNIINEQANANDRIFQDRAEGDLIGYQETTLILVDRSKDELLHTTVSTIPRRTTSINAIKAIMTSVFNRSSLSIEKGVSGVNVAPGADETIHECMVVPQMLEILALPRFLQEKECGVYPGGIGTYIQDNVCFVYPPYDTTQVAKGAETLTILNIPPDVYPAAESTWVQYEGNYIIMSTDDSMIVDTSDLEQSSLGSGVQYLDADAILRPSYTVNETSITMNSDKNKVTSFIDNRRDKFNFATHGTKLITANHMNENTQLAKRNGSMGRISWENAKIGIIKPGMAVKLLTIKNTQVVEYHGIIHRILHSVVPKTPDQFKQFFVSNAKIDVFLTPKPINVYELD
jgi:hypothetical protein